MLAGLASVLVVALVWRAVAVRAGAPELRVLRPFGPLAPYAPRLLALHLGLSLPLLTLGRSVLDPSVDVPVGWTGSALLLPQAATCRSTACC